MRLAPELLQLYAILCQHPEGLSEYELLALLRGSAPVRGLDELELFQVHFLLFHQLYRLRRELLRHGMGSLEIRCLKIRLLPLRRGVPNPRRLPDGPDPLAEYYLDEDNLSNTGREDVRELLKGFWDRFRAIDRREEAYETFGLDPCARPPEIKERFRCLVREHHPDRGGSPEQFLRVVEAMGVLRAVHGGL